MDIPRTFRGQVWAPDLPHEGSETSGSARPASYLWPIPHKRLSEVGNRLRKIRITPPPRVDGFGMGNAKTIRYLGCAYQVIRINPPTHRPNSTSVAVCL